MRWGLRCVFLRLWWILSQGVLCLLTERDSWEDFPSRNVWIILWTLFKILTCDPLWQKKEYKDNNIFLLCHLLLCYKPPQDLMVLNNSNLFILLTTLQFRLVWWGQLTVRTPCGNGSIERVGESTPGWLPHCWLFAGRSAGARAGAGVWASLSQNGWDLSMSVPRDRKSNLSVL